MQKTFIPFALGYVCVIAGALLHIFEWQWSVWLFGAGAVLAIVSRMLSLPKTDNRRVRRLYGQLFIGALCLLGSTYLMYIGHNAWVLPLLITSFIDVWVSFRLK